MKTILRYAAIAATAFITSVLVQSALRLHTLLTTERIFTTPMLTAVEFAIGLLESLIVCGVCLLFFRKPTVAILCISVGAQLIWMEAFVRSWGTINNLHSVIMLIAAYTGPICAGVFLYLLIDIRRNRVGLKL